MNRRRSVENLTKAMTITEHNCGKGKVQRIPEQSSVQSFVTQAAGTVYRRCNGTREATMHYESKRYKRRTRKIKSRDVHGCGG